MVNRMFVEHLKANTFPERKINDTVVYLYPYSQGLIDGKHDDLLAITYMPCLVNYPFTLNYPERNQGIMNKLFCYWDIIQAFGFA